MKKIVQNVLIRALCLMALGVLLLVFSRDFSEWAVRVSGLLFILPGCVSLVSFFRRDPEGKRVMLYPVIGLGSILFGLVLIVWPELFVQPLCYILLAVLLLAAATQCYTLWDIRRNGLPLHGALFLAPLAQLVLAGVVLFVALEEKDNTLSNILLGIGFLIYALVELWSLVWVRKSRVTSASGAVVQHD